MGSCANKRQISNPNMNTILVKAHLTGDCLAISTYSRAHGRHGRFLVLKNALMEWMMDPQGRAFYDSDCGNMLRLVQNGTRYDVTIYWLYSYGNGQLKGVQQFFSLSAGRLFDLLMCGGKPIQTIYSTPCEGTRIDTEKAAPVIRKIGTSKRERRAFCKAMRDCFQWNDETVCLMPDFGSSFFFTTRSGWPSCGGLILHETTVVTPRGEFPKLFYSVHT